MAEVCQPIVIVINDQGWGDWIWLREELLTQFLKKEFVHLPSGTHRNCTQNYLKKVVQLFASYQIITTFAPQNFINQY
ncbi:hypothetical protein [uncultured Parabacteroides sp.]|uniref:hypothetical protein n=1 Tax=uncultured Parabacteroides sp. TaxID=512312 RepID=UPI00261ADEFB|nr:hypothetical protein [uncultured Parabacteroides sp.]